MQKTPARTLLASLVAALGVADGPARGQIFESACGTEAVPCAVEGGEYLARRPEGAEGTVPALVYLHGYAARHASVISGALAGAAVERGFAVIAPGGQVDPLQGSQLDWGVSDGTTWARDDQAFLAAVIADAIPRFGLDPERVLVAGYSRGGSMAWELACRQPDLAAGFASASGGFWVPLPEACSGGGLHLLHLHGFTDRTIPFEGHVIEWYGATYRTAPVMESIDLLRRQLGCADRADLSRVSEEGWRKTWGDSCAEAGSITLVLTEGGHGRQPGWPALLLDWAEGLPGWQSAD